jgi:hypothetical protein
VSEPQPEVEVVMTIKLRGDLASMDQIGELVADMDVWMAERYPERYTGVRVKLDVMADPLPPLPHPADQAAAERIAREQGFIQ